MQAMNHILTMVPVSDGPKLPPEGTRTRKKFVRSLEYELMASLVMHQYARKDQVNYAALLSIPLKERIPALANEYGLKRMHGLIRTVLQEFCISVALPKSKKLSDTGISVCACDLMLVAYEDQFSMEDLIIFFELALKSTWGKFRPLLTHFSIMDMLHNYREERHRELARIRAEKESGEREAGPKERICPEPTPIRNLFGAKVIPFK